MEHYRKVTVIHWVKPFGRLLVWSQHEGLHAHGFYYNGRRAMYAFSVSFRPFHMHIGRAS